MALKDKAKGNIVTPKYQALDLISFPSFPTLFISFS